MEIKWSCFFICNMIKYFPSIDHYYIIIVIIFAPGVLLTLPVGLKDFLFPRAMKCYRVIIVLGI